MSHKTFTRTSVLILLLLVCFAIPVSAKAGGACSDTYTVQQDETIDTLAATCGTTTSAIYAANPGISVNLYIGQVVTIPSSNCPNCAPSYSNCYQGNCAQGYSNCGQSNCAPGYYNCSQGECAQYYYNCIQSNCAQSSLNGTTYVVQFGDTFGDIANRFGVSLHDLWSANPNIGDINLLYPGEVLNIPASFWSTPVPTPPWYGPQYNSSQYGPQYGSSQYGPQYGSSQYGPQYGSSQYGPQYGSSQYGPYPRPWRYGYVPTPTEIPTPLSYGKVSPGSPMANVELSNKANGNVYVSLQGTARDGTNVIREYPVSGTFSVTIPAGYYNYVAWVGGQEFSGAINLPGRSSHSITFNSNGVIAQ